MQKISSIVLYILAAISVILAVMFFVSGSIEGDFGLSKYVGHNLVWAVVLLGLAVVAALVSSIWYMVTHPKVLIGGLISLAFVVVLFLIAYFLAPSEAFSFKDFDVTAATSKWVSTGLNLTYILGGIAIFGMVFSEIYRAFK
ncbi:MAG: hypothetical protein JXB34_03015 [Bacteroidales bacterium]|nr:hypothetical protein [Bacteroidales bacterium]